MISHPGSVSLPLLFFLLALFVIFVAVYVVPFIVPPLCHPLPPHVEIILVPQFRIVVVVALLLLHNGPLDTSPLIPPPLRSAAAAAIALFLLLRLLILRVNKKWATVGARDDVADALCMAPSIAPWLPPCSVHPLHLTYHPHPSRSIIRLCPSFPPLSPLPPHTCRRPRRRPTYAYVPPTYLPMFHLSLSWMYLWSPVLLEIIVTAPVLFHIWWWVLWHAYILYQNLQRAWSIRNKSGWKTLVTQTIDEELVRKVEVDGLLLVLVRMYLLRTGE